MVPSSVRYLRMRAVGYSIGHVASLVGSVVLSKVDSPCPSFQLSTWQRRGSRPRQDHRVLQKRYPLLKWRADAPPRRHQNLRALNDARNPPTTTVRTQATTHSPSGMAAATIVSASSSRSPSLFSTTKCATPSSSSSTGTSARKARRYWRTTLTWPTSEPKGRQRPTRG